MKTYLLVNDDGIDSPLLHAMITAFSNIGNVIVAAPMREQSWVGKCMSRFKEVAVEKRTDLDCDAYSIDGSPADCVNLAIGHLLPQKPDAIVSGINVGHNAGLAYILSSGTIGAALEGSLHGIPAFAASMGLERSDYDRLKDNPLLLGEKLGTKAAKASEILTQFVEERLQSFENPYAVVHSLNFPTAPLVNAEVVRSNPALTEAGSFFTKPANAEGYSFMYRELKENQKNQPTDRETLQKGDISYSRLDFSKLGM